MEFYKFDKSLIAIIPRFAMFLFEGIDSEFRNGLAITWLWFGIFIPFELKFNLK